MIPPCVLLPFSITLFRIFMDHLLTEFWCQILIFPAQDSFEISDVCIFPVFQNSFQNFCVYMCGCVDVCVRGCVCMCMFLFVVGSIMHTHHDTWRCIYIYDTMQLSECVYTPMHRQMHAQNPHFYEWTCTREWILMHTHSYLNVCIRAFTYCAHT